LGGDGAAKPPASDCSGLVQAAYKVAGIALPRVAQDKYDATTKLEPDDPLQPGDLLFFGRGRMDITHVGIFIGGRQMVDAPHSGAVVRIEVFRRDLGRLGVATPS
jgi:cell wall-associated NlpC family hydrolase